MNYFVLPPAMVAISEAIRVSFPAPVRAVAHPGEMVAHRAMRQQMIDALANPPAWRAGLACRAKEAPVEPEFHLRININLT